MRQILSFVLVCVIWVIIAAGKTAVADLATIAPTLPEGGDEKPGPGVFLVATRALDDSFFGRTVVYLVDHGADGSVGLIVNRSSAISLAEALPDLDHEPAATHALYYGGPVGLSRIMMLVRNLAVTAGMAHVVDGIYLSADRRVFDQVLATAKDPGEARFYLGHSGWAPGQLAGELERGSWHVVAGNAEAVFSAEPESLWRNLIDRLEPKGIPVDRRPPRSVLQFAARLQ